MSKKLLAFLLITCCTIVPQSECFASVSSMDSALLEQVKKSYEGKNFLVLGDSIGAGYKLDSANDSYSMLLSDKLKMNCKNIAVNGTKTRELFDKINGADINEIKNADVINISIGGNDVMLPVLNFINDELGGLNGNYGDLLEKYETFANDVMSGKYDARINGELSQGLDSFLEYFPKLIKRIKEINPNATIITQTVSNPLRNIFSYKHLSDVVDKYLIKMNDSIKQVSTDNNIYAADVYNALKDESGMDISNISKMDIHPNKSGHYDIYLCIYKALTNEYPDDIKVNIDDTSYRIEYNDETLSPCIYIKPKEGYRVSLYLDVRYDNKVGIASTEKQEDGSYKVILKPHHLYKNVELSGPLVKLSETSEVPDDSIDILDTDNKVLNTSTDTASDNAIDEGKKLNTSDIFMKVLFIFAGLISFIVYKLFKYRFRKE